MRGSFERWMQRPWIRGLHLVVAMTTAMIQAPVWAGGESAPGKGGLDNEIQGLRADLHINQIMTLALAIQQQYDTTGQISPALVTALQDAMSKEIGLPVQIQTNGGQMSIGVGFSDQTEAQGTMAGLQTSLAGDTSVNSVGLDTCSDGHEYHCKNPDTGEIDPHCPGHNHWWQYCPTTSDKWWLVVSFVVGGIVGVVIQVVRQSNAHHHPDPQG